MTQRNLFALFLGAFSLVITSACAAPTTKPYRPNPPRADAPRTELRVAVTQQIGHRGKDSFGLAFLGPAFVPGWVAMGGSVYEEGKSSLASPADMVAQELAASQMFAKVEATSWDAIRDNPDAYDLLVVVQVKSDRRKVVLWPSAGAGLPGFIPMLVVGLFGVPGGTVKRWLEVELEARVMAEPNRTVWTHNLRMDSRRRMLFIIPAYQRPKGAIHSKTYDAETPELYREGLADAGTSLAVALEGDIPKAIADARARRPVQPSPQTEPATQDEAESEPPAPAEPTEAARASEAEGIPEGESESPEPTESPGQTAAPTQPAAKEEEPGT